MTKFILKRIYEPANQQDGYRVLVDRLWPRGVSKEEADLDAWAKDIAPSTELREWFGHQPERYAEFTKRYKKELDNNPLTQDYIKEWHQHPVVTLLYGAKNETQNEAVVLADYLK